MPVANVRRHGTGHPEPGSGQPSRNSVYFRAEPRANDTGYFASFAASVSARARRSGGRVHRRRSYRTAGNSPDPQRPIMSLMSGLAPLEKPLFSAVIRSLRGSPCPLHARYARTKCGHRSAALPRDEHHRRADASSPAGGFRNRHRSSHEDGRLRPHWERARRGRRHRLLAEATGCWLARLCRLCRRVSRR